MGKVVELEGEIDSKRALQKIIATDETRTLELKKSLKSPMKLCVKG